MEVSIRVNGRDREVRAGASMASLLRALGLDRRLIVVELNGAIVRPPELEGTQLAAGDRVELVHFVGGG